MGYPWKLWEDVNKPKRTVTYFAERVTRAKDEVHVMTYVQYKPKFRDLIQLWKHGITFGVSADSKIQFNVTANEYRTIKLVQQYPQYNPNSQK